MIPEQDGKDDAAQVTHRAHGPTQDSIRKRMDVRHQGEVGAIASLEEEGHACDEAEHGCFVVRIGEADGEEEDAGDDANEGDPGVLEPEVAGEAGVEDVGDDAAEWSVRNRNTSVWTSGMDSEAGNPLPMLAGVSIPSLLTL